MAEKPVILEIDKQHFTIKLYEDLLNIDVKGSAKNEIVEALENTPILRETIGSIMGLFIPLHIRLSDIISVRMQKTGKVKIVLSHSRDVVVPVGPDEAKKLARKLNQLIPAAKQRELERLMRENVVRNVMEEKSKMAMTMTSTNISKLPHLMEREAEVEKEIERKMEEEGSD